MGGRLTAKKLREVLDYEPETGLFRWKIKRGGYAAKADIGSIAGTISKSRSYKYNQIGLFGKLYRGHRLAFLWMTGKWPTTKEVDHINGDGLDNRWVNLRLATNQQNQANRIQHAKKQKDTPKGVVWIKVSNRYRAEIKVNYKTIRLGHFDTPEQAHTAYATAAKKYFGEYART